MKQELDRRIGEMEEELIRWRRDLHRYAEPGGMEMRTSSKIARFLEECGYEVLTGKQVCLESARMGLPSKEALEEHFQWAKDHGADPQYLEATRGGFTGVIGILHCGDGPTAALRFDIDALGVYENKENHFPAAQGFASCTDGVMHACGHDGHMTIGLGTARLLSEIKDKLQGTVKIIFQPAEEGVRGAKSIVEHGHLDHVDYILGSHLSASVDGKCHISPGKAGTFATTKLDVIFRGKASHAGISPQEGNNAMLAAASAVLNLQAIPRHQMGSSRINVGTLHAGTGRNVICDRAKMELEVRGETTEINAYMEQYARRIIKGAADMHGCNVEIQVAGSSDAIECSPEFVEIIRKICAEKLDISVIDPTDLGGSEDFAYMTGHVIRQGGQACFTGIDVPCEGPFHSSGFDFDERALKLGVKYYCGVVAELLKKPAGTPEAFLK